MRKVRGISPGVSVVTDEKAITENNGPLLRAEKLRREVGEKTIVREASFALRSGEVVAITGPSGAGKSSVLRLLNRLDAPSGGRVLLEGADTSGMDVHDLRRRVGMVMQQANLFLGTVADNVRYGPGCAHPAGAGNRMRRWATARWRSCCEPLV